MTNNYNTALFNDKESEMAKTNAEVIKEVSSVGRCNNCAFFKFGSRKCEKRDNNGKLIRPDIIPVTYSEPTDRGHFIHVIKPVDCNDFTPKNKKKPETKKEEMTAE